MNTQDLNTKIDEDIEKLKEVRRQFDLKTKDIVEKVEEDNTSVDSLMGEDDQDKAIESALGELDDELNDAVLKFAPKE